MLCSVMPVYVDYNWTRSLVGSFVHVCCVLNSVIVTFVYLCFPLILCYSNCSRFCFLLIYNFYGSIVVRCLYFYETAQNTATHNTTRNEEYSRFLFFSFSLILHIDAIDEICTKLKCSRNEKEAEYCNVRMVRCIL